MLGVKSDWIWLWLMLGRKKILLVVVLSVVKNFGVNMFLFFVMMVMSM